ncbi:hypothetical protein SeMB42_g05797 [Synchytrium endobioticum]|uniref:Uncharacterized protein n=1 Tax=Synchytrium endobioticum TaxID=286115 RepID=A0A507CPB9_9FUNG|nr:hypothetical protein SeMB42_g05797 [Synchytrium endobioticum]
MILLATALVLLLGLLPWTCLVALLRRRYGIRFRSIGLLSVSGLSCHPIAAAALPGSQPLWCIHLITATFHARSHQTGSWMTIRVLSPHISLDILPSENPPGHPRKSTNNPDPSWLSDAALKFLLQTGLRLVLSVVDVVVEGLVLTVLIGDQACMELRWRQDTISVQRSVHSSSSIYTKATFLSQQQQQQQPSPPPSSTNHDHFQINIILRGCQVHACLAESHVWSPVLLNTESSITAHLRDPTPEIQATKHKSLNQALHVNVDLGDTRLVITTIIKFRQRTAEIKSALQLLEELDIVLQDKPLQSRKSSQDTNPIPPLWLVDPSLLADTIRSVARFTPTICITTKRVAVESSLSVGQKDSVKITSSVDHIRVESGLGFSTNKRSAATINTLVIATNIVFDMSALEPSSPGTRTTLRLADVAEFKMEAVLEAPIGTSVFASSMPAGKPLSDLAETSLRISARLMSPRIILDDQITAILEHATDSSQVVSTTPTDFAHLGTLNDKVPVQVTPVVERKNLMHGTSLDQRMEPILQILAQIMPWDVTVNTLTSNPSVAVRLSAYNPSHRSNEDALLKLDIGDVTFTSKLQAPSPLYSASADHPANVDILVAAAIDCLSIEAINVDANIVIPDSERRPERLIHFENVEVRISRIVFDMAPLVSSQFLDYFSVVVALSTSNATVARAFEKSSGLKSTIKPTTNLTPSITSLVLPHQLMIALELATMDVVLVSEGPSQCATFGLAEEIAVQLRRESSSITAISDVSGHVGKVQAWTADDYVNQELETFATLNHSKISSSGSLALTVIVDLAEVLGNFSLRQYYIVLVSAASLMKMIDVLVVRKRKSKSQSQKFKPAIQINIAKVSLEAELPEKVRLDVQWAYTSLNINDGTNTSLDIAKIVVSAPHSGVTTELIVIESVTLVISAPIKPINILTIAISVTDIIMINPYGYELSDIIDNSINLSKGLKALHQSFLGFRSKPNPSTGHTTLSRHEIPTVTIDVSSMVVKLCDAPMEMRLSRIFTLGLEEQSARLARHAAFEKRITAKWVNDRNDSTYDLGDQGSTDFATTRNPEIRRAWILLQEFNSRSWLEDIKKSLSDSRFFKPLVTITLLNLRAEAVCPHLPGSTIEKSINMLDPETPDHLEYFELIPRDFTLSTRYASLEFRDHLLPFVAVPLQCPDDTKSTLTAKGLIIIAERLPSYESRREVKLPLDPLLIEPLVIERFVNPPKIYLDTTVTISAPMASRICWGPAMEPALADMVRILDTISRPSVDPSPPTGWWDKLRLMFHGSLKAKMFGGGLVVRMLASRSPYFDPRVHFGSHGMDIGLQGGVIASVGGAGDENILINCEELTVTFPGLLYDERGETDAQKRLKAIDFVVLKLCGGVKMSCGFRFMTSISRSPRNSRVISPDSTTSTSNVLDDLYVNIRRRHVDVIGRGPEYAKPNFYGHEYDSFEGYRSTAIHLTTTLWRSYECTQIHWVKYQFTGAALMKPVIMSFVTPWNEGVGAVGVRTLSKEISGEIFFRHDRVFRLDPVAKVIRGDGFALSEAGETDYDIQRISWSWSVDATHIALTETEGRMIEYGDGVSNTAGPSSPSPALPPTPLAKTTLQPSVDVNHTDWLVPGDPHPSTIIMAAFLWSPQFAYFRASKKPEILPDSLVRSAVDVFSTQINLCHARLHEIEGYIRRFLDVQRILEQRMAIFLDDSLQEESQVIVEKLAVLYEKKAVIDEYIQRCERQQESTYIVSDREEDSMRIEGGSESKQSPFDHHFIVHNISALWRRDIRNAWFKLIDLSGNHSTVKYCMSNAAMRIAQDIISTSSQIKAHDLASMRDAPNAVSRLPSPTQTELDTSEKNDGSSIVDELLNRLVAEQDVNFLAQNEDNADTVEVQSDTEPSALHRLALPNQPKYVASNNPDLPDYVHNNLWVESKYIIQLINAQISMETDVGGASEGGKCILVAADMMQLQSVAIFASAHDHSDPNVYLEDLVTSRLVFNIHNAQFLVAQREADRQVKGATSSEALAHVMSSFWPLWLPIECMIDLNSPTGDLKRVVDKTSASLHRDKSNPLFLKRSNATDSKSFTIREDMIRIGFPDFVVDVNSAQYLILHDVIEHLLVYRPPSQKDRREKFRKMLLAFEQMEDFRKLSEIVVDRQTKVRQAESLMKYGAATSGRVVNTDNVPFQHADLVKYLNQNKDDLVIVLDAMTKFRDVTRRRLQGSVAWQVHVTVGNMVWLMEEDSGVPLCRWMIKNALSRWVHNEDLSSSNTLEIDRISIESLSGSSLFKELLGPYIPDKRVVDFHRQKMLRVFWREMAPVAGIKVVDHLEVNLFPLSFQISYDVGKKILRYIFPKPNVTPAVASSISEALNPNEKKFEASARRHRAASFLGGEAADDKAVPFKSKGANMAVPPETRNATAGSRKVRNTSGRDSRVIPSTASRAESSTSSQGIPMDNLRQMQTRATENRTFIYIKVPESQHCLSYRGSKEKNLEDLTNFVFRMPTLEYRNKTWTWLDFIYAVKKDAMRAAWANAPSLVREKFFTRNTAEADIHQDPLIGMTSSATHAGLASLAASAVGIGSAADISALAAIGASCEDHASLHETNSSASGNPRRFKPFLLHKKKNDSDLDSNHELDDGAKKSRLLFGKVGSRGW